MQHEDGSPERIPLEAEALEAPIVEGVTDDASAEPPKLKSKKKKKDKEKKAGPEGTSRGIETMFRMAYQTHLQLSTLADAKANIMISINGIIISVIIASVAPNLDLNPWLAFPSGVLLLGCLGALVFSILAARPRITGTSLSLESLRSRQVNILFFGNFVQMPEQDFLVGITGLMSQPRELYETMSKDLYSLGTVLSTKYRLLRIAYNIFMAGLIIGVLLFILVIALDPGSAGSTII